MVEQNDRNVWEALQNNGKRRTLLFSACLILTLCLYLINAVFALHIGVVLMIGCCFLFIPLLHLCFDFCKSSGWFRIFATWLFSAALSLAAILSGHVVFTGSLGDSYSSNFVTPFRVADIVLWAALTAVVFVLVTALIALFRIAARWLSRKQWLALQPLRCKHVGWAFFFSFLLFWGICLLTYFPGISVGDNIWILLDPIGFSIQHTLFYNCALYGIVRGGTLLFGSTEYGFALGSVLQLLLSAGIVAYLLKWMARRGCPRIMLAALFLFFLLSPMTAQLSFFSVKDAPYAFILLLFIPLLADAYRTNGESLLRKGSRALFVLTCWLAVWIRNNGLLVILCVAVCLLLLFRTRWKKLLLLLCVAVLIPVGLNSLGMRLLVKKEKLFTEMTALPIQQIAMTVVSNGIITEEQNAFISNMMPEEKLREFYTPCYVDSFKWGAGSEYFNREYVNTHKADFLRTWLGMLPKNAGAYLNAHLLLTFGNWSLTPVAYPNGTVHRSIPDVGNNIVIHALRVLPESLELPLKDFYEETDKDVLLQSSYMAWTLLLLLVFALCSWRPGICIVFVPALVNWATLLLSTPVAFSFRYMTPVYLALPFLAVLALWTIKPDIAVPASQSSRTQ